MKSTFRDELETLLTDLEFGADEGAFVTSKQLYVEVIPISQEQRDLLTLRITVGSRGLPSSTPDWVLEVARPSSMEAVGSDDPAAKAAAAISLKQMDLPRAKPGDTAGITLFLERVDDVPFDGSDESHETDSNGVCQFRNVPATGTFKLALEPERVHDPIDVIRNTVLEIGVGAFEGTLTPAEQPTPAIVRFPTPDPRLAGFLRPTKDGMAQLTIETEDPKYDHAIVRFLLGHQRYELTLGLGENAIFCHCILAEKFSSAAALHPTGFVVEFSTDATGEQT